jgi:protein TonB
MTATESSFRRPVSARLKWALGLSVVLHVGLVVLIQDQPGGDPSLSGISTLDARIEPQLQPEVPMAASPRVSVPASTADGSASEPSPVTRPASDGLPSRPEAAPASTTTVVRPPTVPTPPTAGVEMPFVRDPTYYAMAALDTPPRLLGSAETCYPQGAVGEVAYQISINEHGTVDEASVVSVKPQGLFTGAAVELCSRLKFAPATKDGRAVRSRVRLVIGQPAA